MSWSPRAKGRLYDRGSTNKLEADFEVELDRLVAAGALKWRSKHEPLTIRLDDSRYFYKPDYLVLTSDDLLEIRECKGTHWPMKNKIKTWLMAVLFPIPVVICRRPKKNDPWEYEGL